MNATTKISLEQLVKEFLINGFVVFEHLIAPEKVDSLHQRISYMLEGVRARNTKRLFGELTSGRERVTEPLRYKIVISWELPFFDPVLYENPLVMAFLERLWGIDDFEMCSYGSYRARATLPASTASSNRGDSHRNFG